MKKQMSAVLACAALVMSSAAFAAGSIAGTVAWAGAPVKAEKLKRQSDPVCAKKDYNDETVLLSKDGKSLANVLVRITKNAPTTGKVPTTPIHVEQKDCMYRPRVQGAVEGQKVEIQNADPTLHNVHSYAGTKTLFNQAQPPNAKNLEKDTKGADVIKLKCDVHPWMTGYIVVTKHPFFAVSSEDGKFEIKDVPAGSYTVEAWHEKLGTQTAEVVVTEGKPADAKFSFSQKKS
ncbi:MAG: carboxypeptidase regulatory-like domain-containing protein [Myxococcaceae bacterium]